VNAVGSSVKVTRELDTAAVKKARLFVDARESALSESGDILMPLAEKAIREEHIRAEIGDVLMGRVEGRKSSREITLFKSLGLAVEDLAAVHFIYSRAVEQDVGTLVELGGARRESR
jgi:ornithine cyclodeaminase